MEESQTLILGAWVLDTASTSEKWVRWVVSKSWTNKRTSKSKSLWNTKWDKLCSKIL